MDLAGRRAEGRRGHPGSRARHSQDDPGPAAAGKVRRDRGRRDHHRYNLAASVLIKDNHVLAAGGAAEEVRRARRGGLPMELEVDTLAQLREALAARVEAILLDVLLDARPLAAETLAERFSDLVRTVLKESERSIAANGRVDLPPLDSPKRRFRGPSGDNAARMWPCRPTFTIGRRRPLSKPTFSMAS